LIKNKINKTQHAQGHYDMAQQLTLPEEGIDSKLKE